MLTYRDLASLDDLRTVMTLERDVWAMTDDELVPASLLLVSVKCGAVVIGALDGSRMVGFVYSFPGDRHGHRLHWSHMLGVVDGYRDAGIGRRLKLMQRARVLDQGTDLIEWTYDPLQAPNAHFNFSRLGVVVREYLVDAYGATNSPLHRGAATDRLVAQWWLRSPDVLARARAEDWPAPARRAVGGPGWHVTAVPAEGEAPVALRLPEAAPPVLNPMRFERPWWVCDPPADSLPPGAQAVRIAVPPAFTAMLGEAPEVAQRWRAWSRHAFQLALAGGLVVVGFERDETSGGHYVLTRESRS